MDLQLSGQRGVVVGGASGIGRAIVRAFVAEGCRVGVVDRDAEALDRLAEEESAIVTAVADVADEASVMASRDTLLTAMGGVEHVVVAAANSSGKYGFPYWNLAPGDWQRVLDVSLMGTVRVAHAFGPGLAEQGRGTMLFLTSVAGQMGSQTDPPYSAAKAAVINFMQCAAKDLAPFDVRVNALAPGMVKTSLNRSVWVASQGEVDEDERQSYEVWAEEKIRRIAPLGRWQDEREYGAMAVFLASPHACNLTGQVINIDGGQVMRG